MMNNNKLLIIAPKWVITCEEKNQVLEGHVLVIDQNKISSILPKAEAIKSYPDVQIQHYPNHALLPGFINSHTHIAMNLFRGIADDLPLMTWLNDYVWPLERKWVSKEMVYDASLLAMGEMIRGGTTAFNDMYFFPAETAKATEKTGMRAHIGITIMDFPTAWAKTVDEYFIKGMEFYHQYQNHSFIKPTLAPQGVYTVLEKNLRRIAELSKKHQLKVNIHCQESISDIESAIKYNQKRPLHCLHDAGLLNSDLIAVHMTQINEEDFALLSKYKPSIIHCPESNMKLASGASPVTRLLDLGLNVALGTDGAASNNDLDMIGEMRTGAFLAKLQTQNPSSLSAETMLKMATIHGAKALGIEKETGSLTPGKFADMIAIELNQIETQPLYHPISQIVYAACRSQVSDVWVAGKQLLKNRQLQTLDETALLQKAQHWQTKITHNS